MRPSFSAMGAVAFMCLQGSPAPALLVDLRGHLYPFSPKLALFLFGDQSKFSVTCLDGKDLMKTE